MDVLLFGAGASHGSEPEGPVPPLGDQLYHELAMFAPATWGALPAPWPRRFSSDFEEAMGAFIDTEYFAAPLQWDMAEFFFRFIATSNSAYAGLLAGLRDRVTEFVYATLNYEHLFVQACVHAGVRIRDLTVCFPHGHSFLMYEALNITPTVAIKGRLACEGGKVRHFKSWAEFVQQKVANALPPVMSYYEPNKHTLSGADHIRSERAQFKASVETAEKIAIIGARVHSADKHIWEPLASTRASILYASGQSGAAEYSEWATSVGREGDVILDSYFRESIDTILEFMA